jgi:hypothetical protein
MKDQSKSHPHDTTAAEHVKTSAQSHAASNHHMHTQPHASPSSVILTTTSSSKPPAYRPPAPSLTIRNAHADNTNNNQDDKRSGSPTQMPTGTYPYVAHPHVSKSGSWDSDPASPHSVSSRQPIHPPSFAPSSPSGAGCLESGVQQHLQQHLQQQVLGPPYVKNVQQLRASSVQGSPKRSPRMSPMPVVMENSEHRHINSSSWQSDSESSHVSQEEHQGKSRADSNQYTYMKATPASQPQYAATSDSDNATNNHASHADVQESFDQDTSSFYSYESSPEPLPRKLPASTDNSQSSGGANTKPRQLPAMTMSRRGGNRDDATAAEKCEINSSQQSDAARNFVAVDTHSINGTHRMSTARSAPSSPALDVRNNANDTHRLGTQRSSVPSSPALGLHNMKENTSTDESKSVKQIIDKARRPQKPPISALLSRIQTPSADPFKEPARAEGHGYVSLKFMIIYCITIVRERERESAWSDESFLSFAVCVAPCLHG